MDYLWIFCGQRWVAVDKTWTLRLARCACPSRAGGRAVGHYGRSDRRVDAVWVLCGQSVPRVLVKVTVDIKLAKTWVRV